MIKKRTLGQIESDLRAKLKEASSKDADRKSLSGRDIEDPYGIGRPGGPVQIDIGLGGAGKSSSSRPRVWRGPEGQPVVPRAVQKPRVTIDQFRQSATKQEVPKQEVPNTPVGTNVPGGPQVWRRELQQQQTPQEKMIAQAQAHTKATGEPVLAVSNPRVAKVLDRIFPAPKEKIEPKLSEPNEPAVPVMRAVEPPSNMQKNIEYWNKAMPTNTLGGKIVDKVMGIKSSKIDEAEPQKYSTDQYLSWAKKYSEQYNVPLSMVLHAMHKETGWLRDPEKMRTAISPAGAVGVMQIIPKYAEKGYGIKVKDLQDPEKNIEAGVRGLAKLFNKYGSPEKALAAYNAGEGGAAKFLKTGDVNTIRSKETRNYIKNYKDDAIHQLEKFFPKDKQKVAQIATDILGTMVGAGTAQAAQDTNNKSTSKNKNVDKSPTDDLASRIKKGEPVGSIAADKVADIDKQIAQGKSLEARLQAEIEKTKAELEKIKQGKQPSNKDQKTAGATYTTVDTQGKQKTYTKNAAGDWVTASGEKLPMPKQQAAVTATSNATKPVEPDTVSKSDPTVPMKTIKISAADAKKLPPVELFGHIFPGLELNKAGGIGGVGTKPYTLPDGTVITNKRVLDQIRGLQKRPDQPASVDSSNTTATKQTVAKPEVSPADKGQAPSPEPVTKLPPAADSLKTANQKIDAPSKSLQKSTTDWKNLYNINKSIVGSNPNLIFPGQKLQMPDGSTYEVKPGDSLSKIASRPQPKSQSDSFVDKSIKSFAADLDQSSKMNDRPSTQQQLPNIEKDLQADALSEGKEINIEIQEILKLAGRLS